MREKQTPEEHREKHRVYMQRYWALNAERINEQRRRRRAINPALAQTKRVWTEKNRERDNARRRALWRSNPDQRRAINRAQYLKHRAGRLEARRLYTAGITPVQFQTLLLVQCGRCAICGITLDSETRATLPSVDHDHSCCPGRRACGRCVRGLLCGPCNTALGMLKDDHLIVGAAAEYLRGMAGA